MCEKSIHHMETNKENSVSLTEWHLCSPATGPVAAWRPCERTTCCHLQPHAPPHWCLPTVPHPRSVVTLVWLCAQKTRPGNLGLALPSRIKASGLHLLTCARLSRPKKSGKDAPQPPPSPPWIFKKALPTPFALTKALPSCCHLNIRAPPKEKGIWHAPFK